MILIAANVHAGSGEIIDFYEFVKNAPKGTSNPQAGRSSRPGCATKTDCLAKTTKSQSTLLTE